MHPLLILSGKAIVDSIPGMTQQISWTAANLLYIAVRRGNYPFTIAGVLNNFVSDIVPDVPLGNWHSFPQRTP